jgi:hypothetical protein
VPRGTSDGALSYHHTPMEAWSTNVVCSHSPSVFCRCWEVARSRLSMSHFWRPHRSFLSNPYFILRTRPMAVGRSFRDRRSTCPAETDFPVVDAPPLASSFTMCILFFQTSNVESIMPRVIRAIYASSSSTSTPSQSCGVNVMIYDRNNENCSERKLRAEVQGEGGQCDDDRYWRTLGCRKMTGLPWAPI